MWHSDLVHLILYEITAQNTEALVLVDEAVDELLELFRRDREWNDGAAKARLLEISAVRHSRGKVWL